MDGDYGHSLKLLQQTEEGRVYFLDVARLGAAYVREVAMVEAKRLSKRSYNLQLREEIWEELATTVEKANAELRKIPAARQLPNDRQRIEVLVGDFVFDTFQNRRRDAA